MTQVLVADRVASVPSNQAMLGWSAPSGTNGVDSIKVAVPNTSSFGVLVNIIGLNATNTGSPVAVGEIAIIRGPTRACCAARMATRRSSCSCGTRTCGAVCGDTLHRFAHRLRGSGGTATGAHAGARQGCRSAGGA